MLWILAFLVSVRGANSAKVSKTMVDLKALSLHAQLHYDKIATEFELLVPGNIQMLASSGSTNEITDVAPKTISNNDIVSVSYFSTNPTSGDWIGAYSPADVDISITVPVKYGFADASPDYLTTGAGTLEFNMTNLRSDIKFYYFKGNLSYPIAANSSSVEVTFADPNQPLRPRIVATGDYNKLNLLWSSATSSKPTVKWGTVSGNYSTEATAATSTIQRSSICGGVANSTGWRDLGLIHTASLVGMKELGGKKLYYIFGDAATNSYSSEHVLMVPPQPGVVANKNRPTTAILLCDMGRGSSDDTFTWNEYGRPALNTSNSIGALVASGAVDVIFHGGDVSYAVGYLAVWDFFMNMISPIASGALYLSTVGNHESDWPSSPSYYTGTDSGGECGVLTTSMLPMPVAPTQQTQAANKPWWSYDVGLMHMIGMSSEHNFTIGSPQYLWLENDLAHINRSSTPWVILNLHRAMYINSYYGGPVASDITVMDLMIANVEPLLWKYRVNLAFYGHNHVMQRQSAVYQSKVVQLSTSVEIDGEVWAVHTNPQATVHMVVGTAGASFTVNAVSPPPAWNELVMYEFGYAIAEAVNESCLRWQFVSSNTGEVLDRMMIIQDPYSDEWILSSGVEDSAPAKTSLLLPILLPLLALLVLVPIAIYLYRRSSSKVDTAVIVWDDAKDPVNPLTENLLVQANP